MRNFVMVLSICFILSCGTLGGLDERIFPTSKKKLEDAIDTIYYNYPEYKIPQNWERFDNWSERGYDFLESRIFYFKSSPEEMYYVTFIGEYISPIDTFKVSIAIRSIFDGSINKWVLENDITSEEEERIEKRFNDEIVTKLEKYTNTKAIQK